MKVISTLFILFIFSISLQAQTPISAVTLNTVPSASSYTYVVSANIYNWGVSPYNTTSYLTGFSAGSASYSFSTLPGTVRLRRVDNLNTSGNFTLVWAEGLFSGASFNLYPSYQNDMEVFFNNQVYNEGADNFFDNTAPNSNNVERLDYTFNTGFSTATPAQMGFPVFDRGDVGAHDPFVIAAITSIDGSGNPGSYGNIVRVSAGNYGDPGPNITYRILKASYPSNLADAGSNSQSRGGVFISLADLGIAAGQTFYGYSILSNDLPGGATSANLVDYTNGTYYPTNSGFAGGLDMVAVTGLYIENVVLPTRFTGFTAVNNADDVDLKWTVENDNNIKYYEIERSVDGINFLRVQTVNALGGNTGSRSYSTIDNVGSISSNIFYYRIKQFEQSGSYYYSKIVAVKKSRISNALLIYPNPVREHLYLTLKNSGSNKMAISVVNSAGTRVLRQTENLFAGNNAMSIDGVDRLSKGVYFISIDLDNGTRMTRRFTKL